MRNASAASRSPCTTYVSLGGCRRPRSHSTMPLESAWADNPSLQAFRFGFAVRNGKVYMPLVESRSDVWVAEVELP